MYGTDAPSKTADVYPNQDIAALNRRIDDLVAFQKRRGAWYTDTGLMISMAAFFISIMTTVVSWYRTYQQDVNALKTQLRTSIQQSNALAFQHLEMSVKFKGDQQSLMVASSILNAQNVLLSKQSYLLAKSLGRAASSIELTGTANALIASDELLLSEGLLKQAVERAENSVDYVAALRVLGRVQFLVGRKGEALSSIELALNAFKRFERETNYQDYVSVTHAYTNVFWASVVIWNDCQSARRSLQAASQHLSRFPAAAPQAQLQSEIERYNALLSDCPA